MVYVDPHVHLRDFNQTHKETVKHGLEVARDSGVIAVFDMPNTDPPIMDEQAVKDRLALAKAADVPEVFYGLYMGLTADPVQVQDAVRIYRKYPQVIGMKLYAGHSTGNLGVIHPDQQLTVIETLAKEGYDGVLAVHAEKEDCMHHKRFDPVYPISHCLARPPFAEIESVEDIIAFARATEFPGKLHIAHISVPIAVERVLEAKAKGLDISSGVCPHHLVYDWEQMKESNGLLWKMNPPLRSPGSPQTMLEYLRDGSIDWIETDHAPHTLDEKLAQGYASGVPGLPWWDTYAAFLEFHGFTKRRIEEVTALAAIKRFGIDVELTERRRTNRKKDYPFNPYEALEQQLRAG